MTNRVVASSLVFCLGVSFVLLTGCAGGGSSSSGTTTPPSTPTVTAPTVTSITPTSLPAGSAATAITVTGTGFTSTTAIQVGGTVENTTYSSSTQISATVSAAQFLQGGVLSVIALNGDATSASGTAVNLTVNNPAPAITQLVPATFVSGSAARSISVLGTGFVPTTTIQVNGSARPTTFVTSTEVSVIFATADLATGGTLNVTAVNPAPVGGTSAAASAAVNNPVPFVNTITPAVVLTTATMPTTVTLTGLNFFSGSTVQVNGANVATTYVSSTQLTFQLTASQQSTAQTLNVAVVNGVPAGGTSLTRPLTVTAPTPTPVISSVLPVQFVVGSGDSQIQVSFPIVSSGASGLFGLGYTVQWNGAPLTTLYESSGYNSFTLIADVPASLLATLGTASVTVNSLSSTPANSAPVTVSITNPPAPTLTSLSPNTGPINTAAAITLNGTGFTSASTVALNGTTVPSTYLNANELTVSLSAANLAMPGNSSFTVTTPAPGGGTTAPQLFTAYIGIVNNSVVYNPVNGLFYVSVPGSVGAPYGNSIVSVDPETGALGTPIPVGSEPNKLALSSDGTILWVGLDGAGAVRQVNLTTGSAGLQFSLGGNGGIYNNPITALALAALPGSPNSVVLSTTSEFSGISLGIYDSGVLRGTTTTNYTYNSPNALQVDGTRAEIYAGSSNNYYTYKYGSSGLTALATSTTQANYTGYSSDEIQVTGGRLYTDFGQAFDAESGSLLGTFYSSGTNVDSGTTTADTTLGKVFILGSGVAGGSGNTGQIQVFNLSDFTTSGTSTIPVSYSTATGNAPGPNRLTRWGTNGLAFRTSAGLYSLRSNLVKDLSTTSADIGVTLAATGTNATGSNTTYTATVTNAGPSNATNVALAAFVPATGVLVSVTPSAGVCSTSNGVSCDLGGLANGASATVAFVVQQTSAGSATLTAQVSASENDPTTSNNQATSSVTVTGSTYNLQPTISSIVPAAIVSGSTDTVVAITGAGFTSGSTVQLGATALTTSYNSPTSLSATVPAAQLTTLGWAPLTVSNPTPGGGTSAPTPLSVYSVITLGVNHILYDPYSRKIMASVGSGSARVTGNSIAPITPETASVGTVVPIGSQPTSLALTDNGQILYTVLTGSQSIARFNMLTQQADYTFAVPPNNSFDGGIAIRGLATQPGTENTIAVDVASFTGIALYDFNPANKTAAIRGQVTGPYTGSCLQFFDATNLLAYNIDSFPLLNHYTVGSAGFTVINNQFYTESTLNHFGCFKLSGGIAFAAAGGVANPEPNPAVQLGVFPLLSNNSYGVSGNVAPDTSLQRTFFAVNSTSGGSYSSSVDSIESFNQQTYLSSGLVSLGFAATEGTNASFSVVDLIRWGQDGLAVLTSTGHIYLLRGAAVVPGELTTGPAAVLASSSTTSITHGGGNVLLTLTGSNFLPGVAVEWNGSYRTTTIVDATHVTVAIPASDLASAGSASLTAVNPGAAASNALTLTIN